MARPRSHVLLRSREEFASHSSCDSEGSGTGTGWVQLGEADFTPSQNLLKGGAEQSTGNKPNVPAAAQRARKTPFRAPVPTHRVTDSTQELQSTGTDFCSFSPYLAFINSTSSLCRYGMCFILSLPMATDWNKRILEVPSTPNRSGIL